MKVENTDSSKLNKTLVGVAGEYYVAAELSKRGYLASITLRNSENIDIICSSPDGSKSVAIQVKTSSGSKPKWILSKKNEDRIANNLYYVFVLLSNLDKPPVYYIVSSKTVAEYVKTSHAKWLAGLTKKGKKRNDSTMRIFDIGEKYKNRWDILKL